MEDDTTRRPQGATTRVQGETQAPAPRQPDERDESVGSQAADSPTVRRMGRIAHESIAAGQTDTDKGPELDRTYHEVRKDDGRGSR